jgi:hypothetical protein
MSGVSDEVYRLPGGAASSLDRLRGNTVPAVAAVMGTGVRGSRSLKAVDRPSLALS